MGYRVNVIVGADKRKSPILFANSHHPDVDLDAIIHTHAQACGDEEGFIDKLLLEKYPSDHGQHKKGESVFVRENYADAGDHEKVYVIGYGFKDEENLDLSPLLILKEFSGDFDWGSQEPLDGKSLLCFNIRCDHEV